MIWKLAEAKNKFSEVFNRAIDEEPQIVKRRGQGVVIVAEKEYERLIGQTKPLKEFLISGVDFEDLDLRRDPSPMRDIEE